MLSEATISPPARIMVSLVPPPMSITIIAVSFINGRSMPTAAANGSYTIPTRRAPASMTASRTAFISACEVRHGTPIMTDGLRIFGDVSCTFLKMCSNNCSVIS